MLELRVAALYRPYIVNQKSLGFGTEPDTNIPTWKIN